MTAQLQDTDQNAFRPKSIAAGTTLTPPSMAYDKQVEEAGSSTVSSNVYERSSQREALPSCTRRGRAQGPPAADPARRQKSRPRTGAALNDEKLVFWSSDDAVFSGCDSPYDVAWPFATKSTISLSRLGSRKSERSSIRPLTRSRTGLHARESSAQHSTESTRLTT